MGLDSAGKVMVPTHFPDVNDDKMNSNRITKYCRITHESLLNQFISKNSYLSRRIYPDNSAELVKPSCGFGHYY